MRLLDRLFPARSRPIAAQQHQIFDRDPAVIYAIGDVHGRLDLLKRIEGQIAHDAGGYDGERWLVMLGDYIDRGPSSAQVLDHLLASPPAGFERHCVAGNHERAMLAFIEDPGRNRNWLDFGGIETLASYGVAIEKLETSRGRALAYLLGSHIPDEHLALLRSMALMIETPSFVFTHAGVDPLRGLSQQTEADLLWARHDLDQSYESVGKLVVHGHTPVERPVLGPQRLLIDTGAYFSGQLTAARLQPGQPPHFLFTA
jgi:serine/threonine protein phosphatase 1